MVPRLSTPATRTDGGRVPEVSYSYLLNLCRYAVRLSIKDGVECDPRGQSLYKPTNKDPLVLPPESVSPLGECLLWSICLHDVGTNSLIGLIFSKWATNWHQCQRKTRQAFSRHFCDSGKTQAIKSIIQLIPHRFSQKKTLKKETPPTETCWYQMTACDNQGFGINGTL